MANNRKIIEACCKSLNLEIEDLSYNRYYFENGAFEGYWKLHLANGKYYETVSKNPIETKLVVKQLCQKLKKEYGS